MGLTIRSTSCQPLTLQAQMPLGVQPGSSCKQGLDLHEPHDAVKMLHAHAEHASTERAATRPGLAWPGLALLRPCLSCPGSCPCIETSVKVS